VIAVQPVYHGRGQTSSTALPASWTRYLAIPGGLGLSSAGNFLFASLLFKVRKLHRSQPIDLIHAHAPLPCGHAAALLSRELGVPFVVTVHGLDAFMTNQVGGYAGQWCKRVSQTVYRRARLVVCISDKVREQVVQGAALPVETTVVYNGVDSRMFSPESGPSSSSTILSVGNLIPIKGHELLLSAFAAIQRCRPDVSLEIIGDGPERSRLRALVASLSLGGTVRFLGRQSRSQVAHAMRRCTLFALPSRYEGLGCVYLEAMSSGKPVVACRGQGIEEVIQVGTNGFLVDPGDLPSLTGALEALLENLDLRRRMGDAARQTILRGFTLAHQAGQLAELYRECLA
jgi:glycosyltransferase involved in cell wall biosynthesis